MKKYTVLFAALAVIALAGCKKEENKVNGILVGGENFVSMDKQAYSPDFGYVMFDGTDAFLFNGVQYGYTMVDNPTDMNEMTSGYSNYAILNVPGEAVVDDVTLLYPADVFPIYIDGTGMMMVSQADNAGDPNPINTCVWPMGYHNGNFATHGNIQLKNAVALIAPAVKYGAPCMQNLFANNPAFANMTLDVTNPPVLTVTHVELVADTKLTGDAEIQFDADDMPVMVMTETMTGETDALDMDAPDMGVEIPFSGSAINYVGNMPVPASLNGANMTINVYFTLDCGDTSFDCVYSGEVVANVARNGRTTYVANMYAGTNWNKITVL